METDDSLSFDLLRESCSETDSEYGDRHLIHISSDCSSSRPPSELSLPSSDNAVSGFQYYSENSNQSLPPSVYQSEQPQTPILTQYFRTDGHSSESTTFNGYFQGNMEHTRITSGVQRVSEHSKHRVHPYIASDKILKSEKQKRPYKRYPKPPYSYLGMIVTAIENSFDKRLTLSEVNEALREFFPFFRGDYTGWKDSVRHSLSLNNCFYKESSLSGKRKLYHWHVDLSKVPIEAFRRQDNAQGKSGEYKNFIHEQLHLPPIVLPSRIKRTRSEQVTDNSEDTSTFVSGDQPDVQLMADVSDAVTQEPCTPPRTTRSELQPMMEHSTISHGIHKIIKLPKCSQFTTDSPENLRGSDVTETPLVSREHKGFSSPQLQEKTYFREGDKDTINGIVALLRQNKQNISSQEAVENLSLLCMSPEKSSLVIRPNTIPAADVETANPLSVDTSFQSPSRATPSSSTSYRSSCTPAPETSSSSSVSVNLPVIKSEPLSFSSQITNLTDTLQDEFITYNGYYTINRPGAFAYPYVLPTSVPETVRQPTSLEYKSPSDFYAITVLDLSSSKTPE